ncbi:hypothetical protein MT418_005800 [Batrachochytrium dendrobatidis]
MLGLDRIFEPYIYLNYINKNICFKLKNELLVSLVDKKSEILAVGCQASSFTVLLLALLFSSIVSAVNSTATPAYGAPNPTDSTIQDSVYGATTSHQKNIVAPWPSSVSKEHPNFTVSDHPAMMMDGAMALANYSSPADGPHLVDFFNINPYNIATAVILILSGISFAFNGHRMFRSMLFIAGFYVFSIVTLVVIGVLESRNYITLGSNQEWIVFTACIIGGLIGGGIFQCLWKLSFMFIGAMLGVALASFILQFSFSSALQTTPGRYIFFSAMAIVGAILVQLFEVPLLIVSTAVVGSGSFFVGIDFFVKSGFGQAVYNTIFQQAIVPASSNTEYIMMGMFVFVALLGMMVQFYHVRNGSVSSASPYTNRKNYVSSV